jgi:hypothetical protein
MHDYKAGRNTYTGAIMTSLNAYISARIRCNEIELPAMVAYIVWPYWNLRVNGPVLDVLYVWCKCHSWDNVNRGDIWFVSSITLIWLARTCCYSGEAVCRSKCCISRLRMCRWTPLNQQWVMVMAPGRQHMGRLVIWWTEWLLGASHIIHTKTEVQGRFGSRR